MNTSRLFAVIAILGLLLVALASCSVTMGYSGQNIGNGIKATYQLLNGDKTKTIDAEAGDTLTITYNSTVEEGKLRMRVVDSVRETVLELETGTGGTEVITLGENTPYRLVIHGDDAKGSFDVSWEIGG